MKSIIRNKRKKTKLISILMSMSLLFSGCLGDETIGGPDGGSTSEVTSETAGINEKDDAAGNDDTARDDSQFINEKIASMTLQEKIAQMIIPAFRRWDIDNQIDETEMIDGESPEDQRGIAVTELNDEFREVISKYSFGGVILFSDNFESTEQTVRLINDINDANSRSGSGIGLFICTDEEGGSVVRLNSGTAFSGNMALAAAGDTSLTTSAAGFIGEELNAVGVNVNLAPDSDVNNNPGNPIIGIRSFSDDPQMVADYASAYIEGLHNENVLAAAKHFPGHGNTMTDSHTGLPMIDLSYEELKQVELVPFESCISAGTDFIMTAHIQYPQIESETYTSIKDGSEIYLPATLSKTIITDILRGDMGYDGLVITDALVMKAIRDNFDPMDTAKLAINAGEDMLLMPIYTNSPDSLAALDVYIAGIVEMVQNGEIDEAKIDAAVNRILRTKVKYGLIEGDCSAKNPDEIIENAVSVVGSENHHEHEWEIAKKGITLVKNENSAFPMDASRSTVVLCPAESQIESVQYGINRLKDDGIIPEDADITVQLYSNADPGEADTMIGSAENVIAITQQFSINSINPGTSAGSGSAFLDAVIATQHDRGGSFLQISARLPYDAARFPEADAVLIAYGPNIPAAIYVAFGGSVPSGKLPVNIPKLNSDYTYSDEILYERGFGLSE